MKLTPEMVAEAEERAEKALEYLDEDGRWELLQERIEQERSLNLEAALRMLELEAIRERVCPDVDRKDWSAVLGGRESLTRWIHRVRAGHALGLPKGKL